METRIRLKNLYLIAVIAIGLIGLGVGSTFAMFTSSTTIDNPIVFNSNLQSINCIGETSEVDVPAYDDKSVELLISNTGSSSINYKAWYISDSDDIMVTSSSNNNLYSSSGTLPSGASFTLTVTFRNSSSSRISVTLGLSSCEGEINLISNMIQISSTPLPEIINENAADYIRDLYYDNKDTMLIDNGSGIEYQTASAENLINDRLGGVSTYDGGNVRYYGSSEDVHNYIYFNCSDYDDQDDNSCELWRIIGVFGDRIKIIRDTEIGTYSWDSSATGVNNGCGINQWGPSPLDGTGYQGADLMKLLNPGYSGNVDLDENNTSMNINNSLYWVGRNVGVCYNGQNNHTKTCDFSTIGLKNDDTRNRIGNFTYNLGSVSAATSKEQIYADERGNNVIGNPPDNIVRQTTWNGIVGLMYLSDYGYASSVFGCSFASADRNKDISCKNNNWLFNSTNEWTLTSSYSSSAGTLVWTNHAFGFAFASAASYEIKVRPVVFLNSDQYIWDGNGTIEKPYKIRK